MAVLYLLTFKELCAVARQTTVLLVSSGPRSLTMLPALLLAGPESS
jgi:hypothetical protein